jgi:hypothetical protein
MKKTILYKYNEREIEYLRRYTLFTCKWFSIKLHNALTSDDGPLHDHPWNYISIILFGGYYEITEGKKIWYGPGCILKRKGEIPHRLELPEGKKCWSLIFTSYKHRNWGLINNDKWISHEKILN